MSRAVLAILVGLLLVGCTPQLPSAAASIHLPLPSEHYRLPNGLEVVLHRDPSFDTVMVDVRYHVGSKDDPEGKSGFAHLQEHLTFRGHRKGSAESETLTSLLESYDFLSWNAFTTPDVTEYVELLPPAQLPVALWIEATRMSRPLDSVTNDAFLRERDVVKNEYRQNYETRAYGLVAAFARAALFPAGHPYHRPTIGDPHDLDRATLDDARAFATRFYTPRNATLVIAGNIDIEEARALVARHFGGLDPGQEPPAPRTFTFPALTADRIIHVEADVHDPRLEVMWPIPPSYAKSSYEAELVAYYVAGIVREDLVRLRQMAEAVTPNVDSGRLGSTFSLVVDLRRGQKPEDALAAIDAVVPALTSPLVRRAISVFAPSPEWWLRQSVSRLSSLPWRATRLQDFVEYFGWPDAADYDLARFRAAASPGGWNAGGAFLNAPKVAVIVRPVPGAPRAGRVVQ